MLMCHVNAAGQTELSRFTLPLTGETVKYGVDICFREVNVSGLCLMRTLNDTIRGSLINEFGVKVLDFQYDSNKKKIKLYNVVKMLDKWYIRKVIRKDIKFLLRVLSDDCGTIEGSREFKAANSDGFIVTNKRYKITYMFSLLE